MISQNNEPEGDISVSKPSVNTTKKTDNHFFSHMIPLLLCILVSITPALFTYLHNILDMTLHESIFVMSLCAAVGVAVYVMVYWLLRLFAKGDKIRNCPCSVCAGLAGAGILALVFNAFIIRMILGLSYDARDSLIVVICTAVLIAAVVTVAVLVARKDPEAAAFLCKMLLLVCVGMALFNTAMAVPDISEKVRLKNDRPEEQEVSVQYTESPEADLPNVYFFILDEYADFSLMEKYYDYTNIDFREFLTDKKFNISDSSFTLVFGGTDVQLANLFCLDAVADNSLSTEECRALISRDSKLFASFGALGYEQCQVSSDANVFPVDSLLKNNTMRARFLSETETGDTLFDTIYNNSLFYFLSDVFHGIARVQSGLKVHAKVITDVFDYYDNFEMAERSNNPTVLYSYVECPHVPFRFDAEGNVLDRKNMANWEDPIYYLQQFQYVTKRTISAIESVLSVDPDSVIILQSDHGLRHTPGVTDEDTMHIFNAVYYRGEELNIDGLTSVDTLIGILDRLGQER